MPRSRTYESGYSPVAQFIRNQRIDSIAKRLQRATDEHYPMIAQRPGYTFIFRDQPPEDIHEIRVAARPDKWGVGMMWSRLDCYGDTTELRDGMTLWRRSDGGVLVRHDRYIVEPTHSEVTPKGNFSPLNAHVRLSRFIGPMNFVAGYLDRQDQPLVTEVAPVQLVTHLETQSPGQP